MNTIDKLIIFYLDFKNSKTSISEYSAKNEISASECLILLNAGRRLNEMQKQNIVI